MHKNKSTTATFLQASIDKHDSGNFIIGKNYLGRVYVRPNTGDVKHNEYFIRLPEIGESFYRKDFVHCDINAPQIVRGYTKKCNIITDDGVVLFSNVYILDSHKRKVILVPHELTHEQLVHKNAEFNEFATIIYIRNNNGLVKQMGTYCAKQRYYRISSHSLDENGQLCPETQSQMSVDSCFTKLVGGSRYDVQRTLDIFNELNEIQLATIHELSAHIDEMTISIDKMKARIAEIIMCAGENV